MVVSIGNGVEWSFLDTTNPSTWSSSNLDVSTLTPARSPFVLDDVVLLPSLHFPSNGEGPVVELSTAISSTDDARNVTFKDIFVGFNGNHDWLFEESCFESIFGHWFNIHKLLDADSWVGFSFSTSSSGGEIFSFHQSIFQNVLLAWHAISASLNLTSGEALHLSRINEVSTLDHAYSCKNFTHGLVTTIHNWRNSSLGSPVDTLWHLREILKRCAHRKVF